MKKSIFRILVLILIMVVFVYYVSKNLGTIEQTVSLTLSQSVGYLTLAAFFAFWAFFFGVLVKRKVFAMLGIERTRTQMLSLQTQALAMNVLVPSAGVSVGVVFAGDAKKKGNSEVAAITAVILALLVDYASIVILLMFAMIYLATNHSLGLQVIIPAIAFLLLTFGLFLLIYFAGKNQHLLRNILHWGKSVIDKPISFFRKEKSKNSDTGIRKFIDELENAYKLMNHSKNPLLGALGIMLLSHAMYLVSIYVLFLSFGIDPQYRVILTGYAIGIMVVVISPTPNGAGLVEGSMALTYASMGIPGSAAVAVTLIYRGMCFWIPLVVGVLTLQRKHLLGLVSKS